MKANPFRYFKTSPEVIRPTVMIYTRFPLSVSKARVNRPRVTPRKKRRAVAYPTPSGQEAEPARSAEPECIRTFWRRGVWHVTRDNAFYGHYLEARLALHAALDTELSGGSARIVFGPPPSAGDDDASSKRGAGRKMEIHQEHHMSAEILCDLDWVKAQYERAKPDQPKADNSFRITLDIPGTAPLTFLVGERDGDQLAAELDVLSAIIRAKVVRARLIGWHAVA